jgi:hypothetical protein
MDIAQSSSSAHGLSPYSLLPSASPPLRPIKYSVTPLESALLQVFILNEFNFSRINTYEKPGGRGPIMVNQVMVNQTTDLSRGSAGHLTNPFQAVEGPV